MSNGDVLTISAGHQAFASLSTVGIQPLDADLTAIAALTTTSYGRAFLALADAAAGRTALGLGTAATHATGDYDAAGAAAAAQAASQPLDSDLTAIAALSTTSYGRGLLALASAAANMAALSGQAGADFSLNSHKLTAVSDGSAVDDAATFGQVTNLINGRPVKLECRAATTAALATVIYANGSSGVGATLTGASVGALGAMDGITLAVGDRLLVKNQVAGEQNGAYVVTAVGSGIAVFILTRATDSDQAADLQNGASYYIVLGTTLADTTWALSNDPQTAITIGTTALAFAQVDGAGSTAAGNGLSRSGNTLSIDTAITVDKTTAQTLTNKTIDGSQLVAASVALAKLATQADLTILGNNSGGTAVPSALTASQVRTLLGLVIGTNVQAYDADLTTYAGITPGALGQAILPMTTLANHGLVLGAAGAAPTALAPDAGTTKFLKNSVASDAPTWQTIAESDVTNLVTDLGALSTQSMLQAAQVAAQLASASGYYIGAGLDYFPSATTGKLDRHGGVAVLVTTEAAGVAATAIGSTVATLGTALTAGQAMWVNIEVDSAGATQQNSGSAAVAGQAVIPATTAGRVIAGWIYIPQGATIVDTALTTPNGNAKFIDARVVRLGPSPTGWQYDQNPWVFASATTFTIAGVDATGYLPKGTRISYNDGAVDYGVVAAVSFSTDTTVTLISNLDYSIANATLTAPRFSYVVKPQGSPTWFNWLPVLAGWSQNPTTTTGLTSVSSTIATSLFNKTAHGLANGTVITFAGISTTTGVSNVTNYYVVSTAANTFQVSLTLGGAAITLGGTTDAAITVSVISNYQWSSLGGTSIMLQISQAAVGISNNTAHTATLPVTAATVALMSWRNTCAATDNGTVQIGQLRIASAATTVALDGILATGANTASGNSNIRAGQVTYQF